MAGDWIKMRASLCTNPKVLMIAEIISESTDIGRRLSTGFNGALGEIVTSDVTRDITIASLMRVWCATNEHTDDGVLRNSTLRTLDQAAGIPGFGEAMEAAGWAIYDADAATVTLPNFLENNAPAKNNARSTSAERQARYRQRLKENQSKSDVTSDVTVTSRSNTREEKRREDIEPIGSIPPYPQDLDLPSWQRWVDYRKQIKKPIKPASAPAAMKSLASYGANQSAVVEQSIANGWQGLFALKAGSTVVNKQVAIEQRNRAVAEEWLAGEAHEAL